MKKFLQRVHATILVVVYYLPKKLYYKILGGDCSMRIVASDGEVLYNLGTDKVPDLWKKFDDM